MAIAPTSLESLALPPKLESTSLVTNKGVRVILRLYFLLLIPSCKIASTIKIASTKRKIYHPQNWKILKEKVIHILNQLITHHKK